MQIFVRKKKKKKKKKKNFFSFFNFLLFIYISMPKSKLGTARATIFKDFHIRRSYTLEISVFGFSPP